MMLLMVLFNLCIYCFCLERYYSIADLAWYQRSVLQAIGGKPPSATYDEALDFFKKAEETSPNFYRYSFYYYCFVLVVILQQRNFYLSFGLTFFTYCFFK